MKKIFKFFLIIAILTSIGLFVGGFFFLKKISNAESLSLTPKGFLFKDVRINGAFADRVLLTPNFCVYVDSLHYIFHNNSVSEKKSNKKSSLKNWIIKKTTVHVSNLAVQYKTHVFRLNNVVLKKKRVYGILGFLNNKFKFLYEKSILKLKPIQYDSLMKYSYSSSNRAKVSFSFDSICVSGASKKVRVDNLKIRQYFLSDSIVVFDSCNIGLVEKKEDSLFLNFSLNKLHLPVALVANINDTVLGLKVDSTIIKAEDFVESFPVEFKLARSVKMKGRLKFFLDFYFNKKEIDSTRYYSSLKVVDAKLLSAGKLRIYALNKGLTVYNLDKTKRISLFDTSLSYIKIDNISKNLINAVVLSEDGSFFYHRGFVDEGFKTAIIDDIQKRRFVRGGSTITMQLVKNIYFSKNKVLSRKIEEIFVSWLIEHYHLVSKDRIMELYLNMIEWGPGIYGIKDAAKYYFNCLPSEITVDQAIYLAMIIPRPKKFRYFFDKEQQLKTFTTYIYDIVLDKMLERNMIDSNIYFSTQKSVTLSGDAAKLLIR